MVTLEQAQTAQLFEHVTLLNTDKTPVRCRATGKCRTWKRQPGVFKLPVKYGLRESFYITNQNAGDWIVAGTKNVAE